MALTHYLVAQPSSIWAQNAAFVRHYRSSPYQWPSASATFDPTQPEPEKNPFPAKSLPGREWEEERNMAANCARRIVQVSSASAKTLLSCSPSPSPFASRASKLSGLAASKPNSASSRFSVPKLNFSRLAFPLPFCFLLTWNPIGYDYWELDLVVIWFLSTWKWTTEV